MNSFNSISHRRGYIHVYTGNGKGKTTAAFGLALRAAGCGMRTFVLQFLKGQDCCELVSISHLKGLITVEQFGSSRFIEPGKDNSQERILTRKGLQRVVNIVESEQYDILILDEINMAVAFGLIHLRDVLPVIEKKPDHLEIVLTGRHAPAEFIEIADVVTEMVEVKHYFTKGVSARIGIEL